jgi:TonB-dependent receptor
MTDQRLRVRLLCTAASIVLFAAAAQSAKAQAVSDENSSGGGSSVETVIVTGTRVQAQAVKQDAPNVLDIRPIGEIQKLPDVNIAEALQRVPGVSLESDSGEGRFINIRGMDADLNGTTFDGVRLTTNNPSSPQGGARAVAFDVLPSGLFGGVEVIKSLTPDIDAEGLGGIVNLLPRTLPTGREYLLDASVGSGTETLRGSPVWDGQVTAGARFGDHDQFSIIASYAFHQDWRGLDDIENSGPSTVFTPSGAPIDNDLEYRWYKYHRTRRGEGATMTWDVDASTSLFLRAFDAGYTEYAVKDRLEIDNLNTCITPSANCDATGTPIQAANGSYTVDDAGPVKAYTDSKETIESKLIEFGGHRNFADDILADFRASWTEGHDIQPFSYGFTFTDPNNVLLTYNPTTTPNTPTFQTLDGTNLTDPSIYTKGKLKVDGSDNMDTESAFQANVTVPMSIAGNEGAWKFGFDVRLRVIRANATEAGTAKVGALSNFASPPDQIYYEGLYNIGEMANFPELVAQAYSAQTPDPSAYQHNDEKVYAEYVQYSTTVGKLSLLGGVRVETTNAVYSALAVDANDLPINSAGVEVPNWSQAVVNNKQDYTNFFPDLNAKYQLTDDWIVRAALTTSLARPGFNEITAARSVDLDNNAVSLGNPALKPITAKNVDLTTEYYLPEGGVAAAGLFYKAFSNYIVPTEVTQPQSAFPGYSFTGAGPVQVSSFADIGAASVKGIELNYQQQFIFLPGAFSGFGFDGNVTYNDSSGDIRVGEKHTLPQTSPWNYNAAIYYEKYGVKIRLAASYVSKNLWAVGGDSTQDLYSQPRFRLDLGTSYSFWDNYEVYFDAKNISNTKLEFTQTPSTAFPVQREFYGTDYLFGVKVHF